MLMSAPVIARSVALFVLAGLLEIGGGYLVWLWLRDGKAVIVGALGGLVLFFYGIVPTFQPAHFGRVYAAYGGVFVVLGVLRGWLIDGVKPDRLDLLGASMCRSWRDDVLASRLICGLGINGTTTRCS